MAACVETVTRVLGGFPADNSTHPWPQPVSVQAVSRSAGLLLGVVPLLLLARWSKGKPLKLFLQHPWSLLDLRLWPYQGESSQHQSLRETFTCHICLGLLVQPVTATCGHSMCRFCYKQMLTRVQHPKCFCTQELASVVPQINVSLREAVAALWPREAQEGETRSAQEEAEVDSQLSCCGGFQIGERVLSMVSRAVQQPRGDPDQEEWPLLRIRRGEEGEVVGPASGDARWRAIRVSFPGWQQAEMAPGEVCRPLPGGFRPGEQVISLIDYRWPSGCRLHKDDIGEVLGPAIEGAALDVERQVLCRFPNSDAVNVFISQIRRRGVAGGFGVGDTIISLICTDQLSVGDEGLVLRRWKPAEDGAERILCGFVVGDIPMRPTEICQRLPGGFRPGDQVVSLINFEWPGDKRLRKRDVGQILGRAMRGVALDEENQVLCRFPHNKSVNVFTSQIRRLAPDERIENDRVIEEEEGEETEEGREPFVDGDADH